VTVVATFDAELYLRELGERTVSVAEEDVHGAFARLRDAAAALIAVGSIGPAAARGVLRDYGAAFAARGGRADSLLMALTLHDPPELVRPLIGRVVVLDEEFELLDGTLALRYAILAKDYTVLTTVFIPRGKPSDGDHHRMGVPSGLEHATLADDRGRTTSVGSSSKGNDERWETSFSAEHPLGVDTRWLDFAGHRLELVDHHLDVDVEIESLIETDSAARHLWRQVALTQHHRQRDLGPAIDALIAAGVVEADDRIVELVPRVGEFVRRGVSSAAPYGGMGGAPDPWPALLRRAARRDGPCGWRVVGVVTPEFDRHFATVYHLESEPEGFSIEAAVSPRGDGDPIWDLDLAEQPLGWWARDDLGSHYIGRWEWASNNRDSSAGTVLFTPALDPRADVLELLPTAFDARAVISVPLRWSGADRE
jgi:hypothetical protein